VGGVRGCCPEGVRGAAGRARKAALRAAARGGQAGTMEVRAAASARDAGSGSI